MVSVKCDKASWREEFIQVKFTALAQGISVLGLELREGSRFISPSSSLVREIERAERILFRVQ